MTDLVPSSDRITREALDRIIRRAAELQAGEREIGDTLTEQQVLDLGRDVGLPARYLQQALLEERHRIEPGRGWLTGLMGPVKITASRTVPGERGEIERLLGDWMTEEELLTVKRRFPTTTSWEPRKDWSAELKRAFGIGGRRYALTRAREVVGEVTSLEPGWCHISLTADLANSRTSYLAGASVLAGSGAVAAGIGVALGILLPVAIAPAVLGVGLGAVTLRSRQPAVERIEVALAQILDRFEHGEVRSNRPEPRSPALLARTIRDEVRKHLGA